MRVFLDTEYAAFDHPVLISIGLVSEDDCAEFYGENGEFDWHGSSPYVREAVFGHLGQDADRIFTRAGLRTTLLEWLEQFSDGGILVMDDRSDYLLLVDLLDGLPEGWSASVLCCPRDFLRAAFSHATCGITRYMARGHCARQSLPRKAKLDHEDDMRLTNRECDERIAMFPDDLARMRDCQCQVSRGGVIEPGMGGVMEPAETGVKRRFERAQECGFLPDLATAFSLLLGIGLGLRKLSPSITTR